jgi:hypothetical protein
MSPMIRTSRTLLRDRVVRVDRRLRISDGLGGEVDSFVTIIERYWCTIWPPHHQARLRQELGEIANQSHFAMADPSRNGRTIMVGDRFIDEKNNERYEVLGVERPRGNPYNRLHRFPLRLVKDGERAGS